MFLDEGIDGSEANTISLRREIAILDENDNAPEFLGRPYAARIPESAEVGDLLLAPGKITVVDKDGGLNSEVRVYCVPSSAEDDICKVFSVRSERIAEGKYDVQIYLAKRLDYERRNSYVINLVAIDGASDPYKRLKTSATVIVDVLDVQVKFWNCKKSYLALYMGLYINFYVSSCMVSCICLCISPYIISYMIPYLSPYIGSYITPDMIS